jgi:HK97 family phage major capsid protein
MDDTQDVRSTLDLMQQNMEAFKAVHTEELREVKARGVADVVTRDRLERIETVLQGLQEKAAQQSLAAKRSARGQETAAYDPQADEHGKAFNTFLRKGQEADLIAFERKAMTVGSDPEGGYAVPHELSQRIIIRQRDLTPLRQIATVMDVSSDALEMLSDRNEAEANWVAETASRAETATPALAKVRIPVHEISAQPKASQKLLDDAQINVEEWLAAKVAERFARREGDAFINGDGVSRPRGLLTYTTSANDDDTRSWGQVQYVASGAAGGFAATNPADKLLDMVYKLKAAYLPKASWLMPRSVSAAIRKLKGGDGNYIWQVSLQSGQPPTLLGFPVVFSEDMPALTGNSLSLAFGDFSEAYTIVDRTGIKLLRDPYTDKPNVKFYTTKRVGGDVVNFDAVKLMKFAVS